jgi:hypothetical protein
MNARADLKKRCHLTVSILRAVAASIERVIDRDEVSMLSNVVTTPDPT